MRGGFTEETAPPSGQLLYCREVGPFPARGPHWLLGNIPRARSQWWAGPEAKLGGALDVNFAIIAAAVVIIILFYIPLRLQNGLQLYIQSLIKTPGDPRFVRGERSGPPRMSMGPV